MEVVTTGETQAGMLKPKLSTIIIVPKKSREYIAPFLRKIYFLILSMLLMVNLADNKRS